MSNYVIFNNEVFREYTNKIESQRIMSKNKFYDKIGKSVNLVGNSVSKYYYKDIKPSTQELADKINEICIETLKLPKGDRRLIMNMEEKNNKAQLRGDNNMKNDVERIDKAIVREIMDKWYLLYSSISPVVSPLVFEYYDEIAARDIDDYDRFYSHMHYGQGDIATLSRYHELVTILCKANHLIPDVAYSEINMLIKEVAFLFVLDQCDTESWSYIQDEECIRRDEYLSKLIEEKRLCFPHHDEFELMNNIIMCIEEDLKEIFIELLK